MARNHRWQIQLFCLSGKRTDKQLMVVWNSRGRVVRTGPPDPELMAQYPVRNDVIRLRSTEFRHFIVHYDTEDI